MMRASQLYALRKASLKFSAGQVVRFSSSTSLIPERNFWDTIYSGTKGLMSLLVSEESRQKFMDIVQRSTINADVLKQARFGSLLTIALFNDLQDPLFHRYKFNPSDFLTGVQPALANFHDTLGQLQNEFPPVTTKEEQAELIMQRFRQIATTQMNAAPDSPWTEQAQKNPDSAAGRLSLMVTPRLFNALFLTTETEAMMSKYKEGTTRVSYVALLSARAMLMDEEEFSGTAESFESPTRAAIETLDKEEVEAKLEDEKDVEKKADTESASTKMEASTDNKETEKEAASEEDMTPVAAQIEVLYEMNQSVDVKPSIFLPPGMDEQMPPAANTTKDETQIWVGTFEGWLNGGPDGALRWRITHLRPPHAEFPGLYHSTLRNT